MREIKNSDISLDCKFYVYRHVDEESNIPVYIGIGTKPNYANTINSSYKRALALSTTSRSEDYYNYCTGKNILFQILFVSDDLTEIKEKEQELILLYGRRDLGTGSLFNLTKGGDSLSEAVMYSTNSIEKSCVICGKEYKCILSRSSKSKYCSRECSDKASIKVGNQCCANCGKIVKRKPHEILKNKNSFCSIECLGKYKSENNVGKNNPNFNNRGNSNPLFRGEVIQKLYNNKLTKFIHVENHPYFKNRMLLSRKVVEDNREIFDEKYFIFIDNKYYLKPDSVVLHIDEDNLNCDVHNLKVVSKQEFFLLNNHKREFGKKRGIKKVGYTYKAILAKTIIGVFLSEDDAYNCYWENFKVKYGEYPW